MTKLRRFDSPKVDAQGVADRIKRIQSRSVKGDAKIQGLKMVLSMIDLTTLEGADTEDKVRRMCFKSQHLHDEMKELPSTAAVCVYPNL